MKKLLATVLIGGLATVGCGYGPSSKKVGATNPGVHETTPGAHDEGKKDTGKKDEGKKDEGKKDHKAPDKQP